LILSIIHNRIILRGSVRYSVLSLRFFRSKTPSPHCESLFFLSALLRNGPNFTNLTCEWPREYFTVSCSALPLSVVFTFHRLRFLYPRHKCFHRHRCQDFFVLGTKPVTTVMGLIPGRMIAASCPRGHIGLCRATSFRCLMPSGPYRTLSRNIFSAASCPLGHIGLYRVLFFRCLMPSGPYRTLSRFSAASCPLGRIGLYRVRVFRCLMPAGPYRTLSRDPPSLCRLPNFTHDHVKRAE
jgi:hypothetical protein